MDRFGGGPIWKQIREIISEKYEALMFKFVLISNEIYLHGFVEIKEVDRHFSTMIDAWGVALLRVLQYAPSISLVHQLSSYCPPVICVTNVLRRILISALLSPLYKFTQLISRGGRYGIFKKNEYFHWMNNLIIFLMNTFFEWIFFRTIEWINSLNEYFCRTIELIFE